MLWQICFGMLAEMQSITNDVNKQNNPNIIPWASLCYTHGAQRGHPQFSITQATP